MSNTSIEEISLAISNIKCLQINLRRSSYTTAHLNQYIKNYDIVFIQEPYVIKSKVCGLRSDLKVYYKETETIKTAIAIINPKINAIFIESLSNEYLSIVKFEFKNKSIYGFSLYCSPMQSIDSELLYVKNSIECLKPDSLVICMDSNAKSKLWFNNTDDNRGDTLIEFINVLNLILLNDDPNRPTFKQI